MPSTGAKCSLAASFPPRISPLSEQQEEGRDLSCEQETEMKGSVCSLHSSSKVNPSHQLLPTQASPELKSSLRIPRQDSQRVSHPFSTHSPTFHLQLSSKSTNKSMLVPRGSGLEEYLCFLHVAPVCKGGRIKPSGIFGVGSLVGTTPSPAAKCAYLFRHF